jgi:hypothetical protein
MLDVVARHELHVVHGEHVGRVGHRDRERGAGAAQRDDLIFARRLGGDELDHGGVDIELGQGNRRHAVLLRQQRGDLLVLDVSELHEVGAELAAIRALIVQGFLELFRRNALLLEKQFPNANRHGYLIVSSLKTKPRADTPGAFIVLAARHVPFEKNARRHARRHARRDHRP